MKTCTVQTKNGDAAGRVEKGVMVWRGIPYGAPPLGHLRFARPQPAGKWDGVFDAGVFGPTAMQRRRGGRGVDENCLTLNIWSPGVDGPGRPVLFFVHGGSFTSGAGSDPEYGGAKLAGNGNAVVVTINYRLGIFGFMDFSFLGEGFDENCGLHDMLLALRWVHENIAAFGGDPKNITVFGQSAGATMACALAASPLAQKYISKVIMMSGGPTLLQDKAQYEQLGRDFLAQTGLAAGDLKKIAAQRLLDLQGEFITRRGLGAGTFTVEVDGELVGRHPIPHGACGGVKNIPMLIGTTKEEMSFFFIKPLAKRLEITGIMHAGVGVEEEEVRRRVAQSYRPHGKRAPSIMLSDMVFRMGSVWYAQVCSAHADIWLYRFDYATPAMKLSGLGAFHSSDVSFVFGNFRKGLGRLIFILSPHMGKAKKVYREMQADFIAFARHGALPWQPCDGKHAQGKCYGCRDGQSEITHTVLPQTLEAFEHTKFKKRSFGDTGNISTF